MTEKHRNKAWLIQKYHKEFMSLNEMGKECGVSGTAILYQMKKFGITRRRKWAKQNDFTSASSRIPKFLYSAMQLFCVQKKITVGKLIWLAVTEYMLKRRFNPYRNNGEMITNGDEI